jgi:hypothetical protein
MSTLWPRLPQIVAESEYAQVRATGAPPPRTRHPAQIYSPVGGAPATAHQIQQLIDRLQELATAHGYPDPAPAPARIAFDRAAVAELRAAMDLTWSEGGHRGTWSFLALVALPHLTRWRFGTGYAERWIAIDLTRHAWARLWWQGVVFESDPELLARLSESDLNQLLERRTLGGDPRIVCALGRAVVEQTPDGTDRRPIIRDVTARLLRKLAFLEVAAIGDSALAELCRAETSASRSAGTAGDTLVH